MPTFVGIKQPDPRNIKVIINRKKDVERPINVWFDSNIIELTKEQASILQWKLNAILKEIGFEMRCPRCSSQSIDLLTNESELSKMAGEIYVCRCCQNAFRKE